MNSVRQIGFSYDRIFPIPLRIFLVLICGLALACIAGGAQEEKEKKPAPEEKKVQSTQRAGGRGGGYAELMGTSQAAQHVAAPGGGSHKKEEPTKKPAHAGHLSQSTGRAADEAHVTKPASMIGLYIPETSGKSPRKGKLKGAGGAKRGKSEFSEFRINKTTNSTSPAGAGGQSIKGKAKGSHQTTAQGGSVYLGRNDGKVQQVGANAAPPSFTGKSFGVAKTHKSRALATRNAARSKGKLKAKGGGVPEASPHPTGTLGKQ